MISLMVSSVIDRTLPQIVDGGILALYKNGTYDPDSPEFQPIKEQVENASVEIAVSLSLLTGLFMVLELLSLLIIN